MEEKPKKRPDIQRWMTQYGASLLRMSFLYLKDHHLAEDAVQDTLIKAFEGYGSFQGRSSEKTWITQILIHVCKNYLRANWWRRIDTEAALEAIPAGTETTRDDALLRAVMELPSKYKNIVMLHYYQELKIREIAEALHMPESTVSVRLKRARERLKTQLKGEVEDA